MVYTKPSLARTGRLVDVVRAWIAFRRDFLGLGRKRKLTLAG